MEAADRRGRSGAGFPTAVRIAAATNDGAVPPDHVQAALQAISECPASAVRRLA